MSLSETAVYFKERFSIPESLEEIKSTWMDMARDKYTNKVPLKPGAREFLVWLRQQGIRTGIASSNGIELVETVLKAQGIQEYLESVHTCCEVPKGKPAPDIYLLVAETLGGKTGGMSGFFEDVPMGILAGKNAGMRVCAVEDTFSASQREEKKSLQITT